MRFEKCYKCGKDKLISFNRNDEFDNMIDITNEDLEGYQMTYGKNKGLFRCKDCKEESVMIKKLLSFNIIDISSFVGWTSVEELKKHYKVNEPNECKNCEIDLKDISKFGICEKTKRVCWRLF